MQVQSLGWEDPLQEGMATHSRILAWRIPWTEEPGRLQPMGGHKKSDTTEQIKLSLSFSYICVCVCVFFYRFFSLISYYKTLSIVSCAVYRKFLLVINPLQYSCLENPTDRGAWEAAVHGVAKSWTQLSD